MFRIIDTSALMEDPSVAVPIDHDDHVVIPSIVARELDGLKEIPEKSQRARAAIRTLLELFRDEKIVMQSIYGDQRNADDQIVWIVSSGHYRGNVKVVTNDLGLQVRLIQHKLDYEMNTIELPSIIQEDVDGDLIDALYKVGRIPNVTAHGPGQCLLLGDLAKIGHTAMCMVTRNGQDIYRIRHHKPWDITPKSMPQHFLAEMLMCPDIRLVTATGSAGSGKTFLSLAAGLELTFDRKLYDTIFITRPIVPVGRDLGYTKGTQEQKLDPWYGAMDMAISDLMPHTSAQFAERIVRLPLTYARGYTVTNGYWIIDEAQNFTQAELKTLLTRAGEGTKVVLTGDVSQSDRGSGGGLLSVIKAFKGEGFYGHVALDKVHRGDVCRIAAERM